MNKTKILYVEDEPFLGKVVKETLEFRGYEVLLTNDGARVLQSFRQFMPDICVLDVMLPNVDGFTLGNKIREEAPQLPVIFLTAKTQTEDVTRGFDSGGTDYMRKPFSVEELIVRIENQLKIHQKRQLSVNNDGFVTIGKFQYSASMLELRHKDAVTSLSHREAQVLDRLLANSNDIVDRRNLLKQVWGDDSFFNSRNLDVYIRRLRDYFSSDESIKIITLKGKGYRFVVPITEH